MCKSLQDTAKIKQPINLKDINKSEYYAASNAQRGLTNSNIHITYAYACYAPKYFIIVAPRNLPNYR